MAIPTTIESLSATAASNGPAGSEQRTLADDGLRQAYAFVAQVVNSGSNIASATTITPPSTGSSFHITGITAITTIASTNSWNGRLIVLIFDGILTFTHSSNLALPGSANITTAANDVAFMRQDSSGAWRCVNYQRATAAIEGTTFNGNTITTGTGVLTLAAAKTLTASNTLTLAGTDGTTMTFPATSTTFNWGSYTPTLSNTTNVASSTAGLSYWDRNGSNISAGIQVSVTPTAAGSTLTTLGISLPAASDFTVSADAIGVATNSLNANGSGVVFADAANNRLSLQFYATSTSPSGWSIIVSYIIK